MAAKETPATRAASTAGVRFAVHEYEHDPSSESYALEAAGALGIDPARVFKTLVVTLRDGLAVCIVPSEAKLDVRALGKHAAMAPVERAERVTGYVAGGISPLGQRRPLPTYLDDAQLTWPRCSSAPGAAGSKSSSRPTTSFH
jgi:Cys-tRNA(Pro)/Cys-tRNA(Cys) deacylase